MRDDYLDTATLPATGAAAVWKYKAVYYDQDEETGAYSDVITITVTGI